MPDVIFDTSPLQYLYQLDLLHILPALSEQVTVPPAVVEELADGMLRYAPVGPDRGSRTRFGTLASTRDDLSWKNVSCNSVLEYSLRPR